MFTEYFFGGESWGGVYRSNAWSKVLGVALGLVYRKTNCVPSSTWIPFPAVHDVGSGQTGSWSGTGGTGGDGDGDGEGGGGPGLQLGGFCLLVADVGDRVNDPTALFPLPIKTVPFQTNAAVSVPSNV